MSNCTPQKRKSSIFKKKLHIFDFEVDENEPKVKQKKKRGPKTGTKHKFNSKANFWNFVPKTPIKHQERKKNPLNKDPPVSKKKCDVQKTILSTKNSSSPLFENKQRSLDEVICLQKVPMLNIQHGEDVFASKNNFQGRILSTNKSNIANNKDSKKEVAGSQKENVNHEKFSKKENETVRKRSMRLENKRKASIQDENKSVVSVSSPGLNNKSFHTNDVPVLFHNHHNATPNDKNEKRVDTGEPAFSAMSDDENVNISSVGNSAIESYFIPRPKNPEEKSKDVSQDSSRTFYHDSSYYINASTPVKYNNNYDESNCSVQNYFGFDEPEMFEEPLVSPIKDTVASDITQISHSTDSKNTFHKIPLKEVNAGKENDVPVTQVIKMLKFGINENENVETKSRSSSGSTSPIFNDLPSNPPPQIPLSAVKRVPRRSYERPAYLRKKHKNLNVVDSDQDSDEEAIKPVAPKKKHHQTFTKKEKDEMQKWINTFNSQCQEIEKFDLLVE